MHLNHLDCVSVQVSLLWARACVCVRMCRDGPNVCVLGLDNGSTSNLDYNEHCGWTLPYQRSSAPINVPSALNLILYVLLCFYMTSARHCDKLRHSNWCYCETNQPGEADQIHHHWAFKANKALSAKIVSNQAWRKTTTKKKKKRKKMEEKKNIPAECGCSVSFQRADIVTCVCAFCFGFPPPLDKQLQQSYPALAYFRAVHRNGTNQEVENKNKKKKQQQEKSPNNNKLWNRCPSSFQQ